MPATHPTPAAPSDEHPAHTLRTSFCHGLTDTRLGRTDDDWREVDRRPAELRATMAKMNGKGKENAIENNEDVEMLD